MENNKEVKTDNTYILLNIPLLSWDYCTIIIIALNETDYFHTGIGLTIVLLDQYLVITTYWPFQPSVVIGTYMQKRDFHC